MVIKSDTSLLSKSKNSATEERFGPSDFGVLGFFSKPSQTTTGSSTKPRNLDPPADVIQPPSSRPVKSMQSYVSTSRPYARPVFKESAPRVAPERITRKAHAANVETRLQQHHNQQRRSSLPRGDVIDELLGGLHPIETHPDEDEEEVIQPSANTSERLNRIIGRPCDRIYSCVDTKYVNERKNQARKPETRGSSKRLSSRRRPLWKNPSSSSYLDDDDDQTECGGSVATVSNLHSLASKSLRRKTNMRGGSLSVLREEIKEMVMSLEERDAKETAKTAKPTDEEKEDREASDSIKAEPGADDTNESCTMMWCKGPPTFEHFVSDLGRFMMCAGTEKV